LLGFFGYLKSPDFEVLAGDQHRVFANAGAN
jgi:hypothetical protein